MKSLIILATLIAVSYGAATHCPMVVCESLDSGCVSTTKDTDTWEVKIQECGSGQYCDIGYSDLLTATNGKTASCKDNAAEEEKEEEEVELEKDMYPGYACTQNSECASDDCGDHGCTGLGSGDTCENWSSTDTANFAKMCGANLYCKDGTCASGAADGEDCDGDRTCAGRSICGTDKKCKGPGDLETDDTCTYNYYCPTDDYCDAGECKAATAYSKGTYGGSCTSNDDCSGSCLCVQVNTKGEGNCGALSNGTIGQAGINTERTNFADSDFNCPLAFSKIASTGCASSYASVTFDALDYGSCYKSFITSSGVALITESSDSAYGLYASIFGFIAYLLA